VGPALPDPIVNTKITATIAMITAIIPTIREIQSTIFEPLDYFIVLGRNEIDKARELVYIILSTTE
jgi:hypothetical protein